MKTAKLEDIADILNGYAFKSSEYQNEGYRVIRITNVQKGTLVDDEPKFYNPTKQLEKYELKTNDILISLTGNVGRVGLVKEAILPAYLNQRVGCIRIKNNSVDNNYLFHFLNNDFFENNCINNSNGIAQLNLSTEWLKKVRINLPDIEKQKKISRILDKADEIRKKKRLANDKLDEFLKSTFISMFGDPIKNEKNFKQEIIKNLFKTISRGKQPEYLEHSNISVINQACIYWEKFKFQNIKYHNPNSTKKTFELLKNDILITSTGTGTLGRCNVFEEDGKFITDSHVTVLRGTEYMLPFFVKWMLRHPSMQDKIYSDCVNGSTNQIELSKEKLLNLKLIVPPIEDQNKFAQIVKKVEAQKQKNELVIEQMDNLFNSLSQKAFKGEL